MKTVINGTIRQSGKNNNTPRRMIILAFLTIFVWVMGTGIGAAAELSLTLAGSYTTNIAAVDVAVSGNYAYVVGDSNNLAVVDISNPAKPVLAGSYRIPGEASADTESGNYAYI